jgi:hypothetical protein
MLENVREIQKAPDFPAVAGATPAGPNPGNCFAREVAEL